MTLLVQILSHKILLVLLVSLIILPVILVIGSKKKNHNYTFWAIALFLLSILNVFFGSAVTNPIINKKGILGTAMVTNIVGTNSTYNERQVMRYEVLLKTQEGQTVETSFESMDFNIYPTPKDGYSYPNVGVEFAVKYLPKDPTKFIILLNEESDYTQQLECNELLSEVGEAQQKMNFDPENTEFKGDYEKLWKDYLDQNCIESLMPNIDLQQQNSFQFQFDPIEIERTFEVEVK